MKIKLISLIIFLSLSTNLFSQPFLEWIKTDSITSYDGNSKIKHCEFDSIGNIYFSAQASHTAFLLDNYYWQPYYAYIVGKIGINDSIEWVKSIYAPITTRRFRTDGICVSKNGNVYSTGRGIGDAYYTFAGITYDNNDWNDGYGIFKHDTYGNELWCKQYFDHLLYCFTVDNSENLIVNIGYNPIDFYGAFTSFPINNIGNSTLGLAKYDINGNPIWAKSYGGTINYAQFGSLSCDSQNNILGTGYYSSNDFILGADTLPPPDQYPDYPYNPMNSFVVKLSPAGDVLWSYALPTEWSRGYNVAVNSKDEIICTGVFRQSGIWFDNGTVLENPGEQARYIMKLSPQGELMWIKCIYVDFAYNQTHNLKLNISFNDEDNIFIGGWSVGSIYFEGDTLVNYDTLLFYGTPITNYFLPYILKFTDSGEFEWIEMFTSDHPSQNEMHGFDVNNEGEIICSGWFSSDSLTFIDTTIHPYIPTHKPAFIVKLKDKDVQDIDLPYGWSYFSTYIKPDTVNIANLFTPVSQNVRLIKNGNGNVYWPQYSVNSIGNYNIYEGYQICMNQTDILQIRGYRIRPQETELALITGWQILPYLRTTPAQVETMLAPIVSNIVIMKSSTGQIYWPQYNVNAISTLDPGKAYYIKMVAQDTLVYPN